MRRYVKRFFLTLEVSERDVKRSIERVLKLKEKDVDKSK